MPKECLKCGFLTADESVDACDRCGNARMRFTLLAGLKIDESPSKRMVATVNVRVRETWFDRFGQAAVFLMWTAVAAFVMMGALVFATPDDVVDKRKLNLAVLQEVANAYPMQTTLAMLLLPAAAAAAGVLVALRGVYLAQQVALCSAPLAALGVLAGFAAVELEPPVWIWISAPVLAGAVGFVFGLRMARQVRASEVTDAKKTEYRVIDPWDRRAVARFRQLSGRQGTAIDKLLLGFAVCAVATVAPVYWLRALLGTAEGGGPIDVGRAEEAFRLIGLAVGGIAAASGSRAPFVQGLLLGAVVAGLDGWWFGNWQTQAGTIRAAVTVAITAGGGLLGGMMFKPPRMARGKRIVAGDKLVYHVDDPGGGAPRTEGTPTAVAG